MHSPIYFQFFPEFFVVVVIVIQLFEPSCGLTLERLGPRRLPFFLAFKRLLRPPLRFVAGVVITVGGFEIEPFLRQFCVRATAGFPPWRSSSKLA